MAETIIIEDNKKHNNPIYYLKNGFLNRNFLKLFALVFMTIDHVGLILLNNNVYFRILGRLAFPVFAYMIGEGCFYTKNKRKYLLLMAGFALATQAGLYIFTKSTDQSIFTTFVMSLIIILPIKKYSETNIAPFLLISLGGFALAFYICFFTKIDIDYGFFGIILPVFAFLGRSKIQKFLLFSLGLVILNYYFGSIQWYSMLSLVPIWFYNGQEGKLKIKYLFYSYYPLHLSALYLIKVYLIGR